jgi:hypothetical protein
VNFAILETGCGKEENHLAKKKKGKKVIFG